MNFDYEVLIIGGGPAGLSAALSLGRISRTALLCDDNRPRNAPSMHVNNLPSRDGVHPAEWRRLARSDLQKYETIKLIEAQVLTVEKLTRGFKATLAGQQSVLIKKVILGYGISDRLSTIPGLKELWGKAIFHCPFCHGFEIRGSRLGFVIRSELALHRLPMLYSLSKDLILFTDGKIKLSADQQADLNRKNIKVYESKVESFDHTNGVLNSVTLESGEKIERQYLFYDSELPFELKSHIGTSLGCEKNEFGLYKVNDMGATSVPGVFAAGDNMTLAQSVLLASAAGAKAGIAAIGELLNE